MIGGIRAAIQGLMPGSRLESLRPVDGATGPEPLRAVSQEFEALLLQTLLHEARRSAGEENGAPSGFAKSVFEEWQDGQLAEAMSGAGGIGLARLLQEGMGSRPNGHP